MENNTPNINNNSYVPHGLDSLIVKVLTDLNVNPADYRVYSEYNPVTGDLMDVRLYTDKFTYTLWIDKTYNVVHHTKK